jgi:hypothetical protein
METEPTKPDAQYGALISIILILAIVVVGAFYVWGKRVNEANQNIQNVGTATDDTATSTGDK